ncbi:MAG: phosphotransferase [Myxococcota bacterium]|jgi:hypothetical protein|nr:phosphotransferase [Myxococcota bacterium]
MNRSEVGGTAGLIGRGLGSLLRLGADRVGESFGASLPRTAEQLARADVVEALLRDAAPASGRTLPTLVGARYSGHTFESSNCTNFLVDVEFEDGLDGTEAPHPPTLYAKLPCPELATRAFANAVGFWETEVVFCSQVAHRIPVRVPRVHAAVQRGSRFVLLLENLTEDPTVRMFINRDMAAGTSVDRSARCLRTFAELHASFYDLSVEERERIFPMRLHTYLASGGSARSRALNAAAIAPTQRRAPDLFGEQHAALCRRAIAKWDALMEAWYGGPLTLIHGDSHLANCFEYDGEQGRRVGLIDFQGLQWCGPLRDVQYHLSNSLEPEVLAEAEGELIDGYLDALRSFGVDISREATDAQYRAYAFQTLMVAAVSLGLGSLTEREDTVRAILRRSVASIDRLGFADWLDAL